jgi:hypothetical protein
VVGVFMYGQDRKLLAHGVMCLLEHHLEMVIFDTSDVGHKVKDFKLPDGLREEVQFIHIFAPHKYKVVETAQPFHRGEEINWPHRKAYPNHFS